MTTKQLTGCRGTYETLGDAVDAILEDLLLVKGELAKPSEFNDWIAHDMPASDPLDMVMTTKRCGFELATLKGRNTRKFFNVVITRMDNGRWEPLAYVL